MSPGGYAIGPPRAHLRPAAVAGEAARRLRLGCAALLAARRYPALSRVSGPRVPSARALMTEWMMRCTGIFAGAARVRARARRLRKRLRRSARRVVDERLRAGRGVRTRWRFRPSRARRTRRRPRRSASSAARHEGLRRARPRLQQRRPRRRGLRAYSTGTGESFLPAHAFAPGEHVTVSAKVTGAGTQRDGADELHRRQPGARRREGVRRTAGRPAAVQHYLLAPTLTPSSGPRHDPGAGRREPRRLLPRALSGRGGSRADDRRSGRRPGVVSPAPGGHDGDELQGPAVRGQAGADVVAGADHRGRLRPGRRRHLQHLPTSRSPTSAPATATTPISTNPLTPDGTAWIDAFDPST